MADTDLSAQFEKLSDKAKKVAEELSAAGAKTRDQLESDVTIARDKAAASAEQFKERARAAGDKASSQWDEIRGKWQAHVAKVREDARRKGAELDAKDGRRGGQYRLVVRIGCHRLRRGRDRGSRVRSTRRLGCTSQGSGAHFLIAQRTVYDEPMGARRGNRACGPCSAPQSGGRV